MLDKPLAFNIASNLLATDSYNQSSMRICSSFAPAKLLWNLYKRQYIVTKDIRSVYIFFLHLLTQTILTPKTMGVHIILPNPCVSISNNLFPVAL